MTLNRQAPSGPVTSPNVLALTVENNFSFGPEDLVVYDNFDTSNGVYSIDPANSIITFKKSGWYKVDVKMVGVNSNGTPETTQFDVYKNGVLEFHADGILNAADWSLWVGYKTVYFAAGDTISMGLPVGITNSITNRSGSFSPVLNIHLVS